jgi:hypothetical protein
MRSIARSALAFVLAALIVLPGSLSRSQSYDEKPGPTVKAHLPGCRTIVEFNDVIGSEGVGLCGGVVDALLYVGELLPQDYRSCVPLRVPRREVIRTIVEDLDGMYAVAENENFKGLVLAILHHRWPCPDSAN